MYRLLHWLQAGLQGPEEAAWPCLPFPGRGGGRAESGQASWKHVCPRVAASTLGMDPECPPPKALGLASLPPRGLCLLRLPIG